MVDILEPLSSEELTRCTVSSCTDRLVGRGQTVYAPADTPETLFLLLEGRTRVYKTVGGRELTFEVFRAGTVFGEEALGTRGYREAYAQALEPSRICSLSPTALRCLVRSNPEVGLKMMELFSERLYSYKSRMADIGLKDIPARLASLILGLIESEGVVLSRSRGYEIPTRYTHQDLGAMIGANRVAVTRAFAVLRETGSVELGRGRRIRVSNLQALRRVAAGRAG